MANFPDNPTDGQQIVEPATDGTDRVAIWTYDSLNQQWTYELYEVYTGEKAIYTDQVIVRQPDPENYPQLQTQMDVNQLVGSELGLTGEYAIYTDQVKERGTDLTQAQINVTSAASHSAVAQNVDQIQGTKSKELGSSTVARFLMMRCLPRTSFGCRMRTINGRRTSARQPSFVSMRWVTRPIATPRIVLCSV